MKNYTGLSFFSLLGVPITIAKKEEILEYISKWLHEAQGIVSIFTPNPEILEYAQQHPDFKEIVRTAQINLPDGSGVVWAIRQSGGPIVSRLAGVDFMENLCQIAADQGFSVGFLGTHPNLALAAYECLKQRYPRLEGRVIETPVIKFKDQMTHVKGRRDIFVYNAITGEWEDEDGYLQHVVDQMRQNDIRIVFVALGFPKQEYFITALRDRLEKETLSQSIVLMAVGGSLDYLSGAVPRAPHWLRDRAGEWVYRLIRQPWRIKRQLRGGRFFLDVIRGT